MIKLQKPLEYNENIKPICLPTIFDKYSRKNCESVGWGRVVNNGPTSPVLKYVRQKMMTFKECRRKAPEISRSQICAGNKTDTVCSGDSGGPFECGLRFTGQRVIEGIVSYGSRVCGLRPVVYTRVLSYISWINNVQKKFRKPQNFGIISF